MRFQTKPISKVLGKVDTFGMYQLPKLTSLYVLKQLKRSAEAIKDFDKNFALCMHDKLIISSVYNMASLLNSKVLARMHFVDVQVVIHVAREIV